MLKPSMLVIHKHANKATSDKASLNHQRAKSLETVPRMHREDTSGQRHTRSISMTTIRRLNDMEIDLSTGCEDETVHHIANSKAVRPSDLTPKHAPEDVASEAIEDELQEEEEEDWIQDEMQESVKQRDRMSKTEKWILVPNECWEDKKDKEVMIECYRCVEAPGGY